MHVSDKSLFGVKHRKKFEAFNHMNEWIFEMKFLFLQLNFEQF